VLAWNQRDIDNPDQRLGWSGRSEDTGTLTTSKPLQSKSEILEELRVKAREAKQLTEEHFVECLSQHSGTAENPSCELQNKGNTEAISLPTCLNQSNESFSLVGPSLRSRSSQAPSPNHTNDSSFASPSGRPRERKRRNKKAQTEACTRQADIPDGAPATGMVLLKFIIAVHKVFVHHKAHAFLMALAIGTAALLSQLALSPLSTSKMTSAGSGISLPKRAQNDASQPAVLPHRSDTTFHHGSRGGYALKSNMELQRGAQLEASGQAYEAMTWYRKAALHGSAAAAVRMGAMVEAGMQDHSDEVAAGCWYAIAAEAELAQGQYELGRWLGQMQCRDFHCETVLSREQRAIKLGGLDCDKHQQELAMAHWWRKAAEQGHTGAQAALGQLLASGAGRESGVSVEQHDMEALQWLRRAAQGGNATAMVGLASMMADGRGGSEDEAGAVRWLTRAAQLGLPNAQYNLGNMLFSGRGCAKDPAMAAQWYRRAADQGHAQAQSNLGSMLAAGEGGTTNFQAAIQLFRRAANQDETTAQYNLGNMLFDGRGCKKDEREAATWYKRAADQGYMRAQFAYAVVLSDGRGVKSQPAEARKYYLRAAENGLPEAQFNLGYLLAAGNGIPKDEQAAAMWFIKAGSNGHVNSMFNVGNMYYDGRGLVKNSTSAFEWYQKAAANGHAGAAYNAGVMLESGEGTTQIPQEAVVYYTMAAEKGMAQAQTALGIMLESGKGCTKDTSAAKAWFRKAAKQGHQSAIARLYAW